MAIEEPTYDPKFRPTTSDVAVFIKNRTVDNNNNFIGDFTDTTIVTAAEVEHIITQAGSLVLSALRWDPTAPEPTIPEDNVPTQSKTAQFTFPDDPMVNWQTAF
jgi:hypothetical protein